VSSRFTVTIEGRKYEVEVYEKEENIFLVKIEGREYIVYIPREVVEEMESAVEEVSIRLSKAIEDSVSKMQRLQQPVVEEFGLKVVCEIPGRIVRIVVKEGDFIDKGQTIALLESMKMVIEVKSPYRGRVKKILVKEGSFIDVGQLIAVLESV
jgi:biotin carboxyl carrier protein